MPVSEDEFERPMQMGTNQSAMSKAEQRKSNKPIMEKRRRARINHCLNELKSLILDAMKKDPARHSKLEKADILEMTVKHLQQIQRQQLATAVSTDPGVIMRFKSGFDECAAEVSRYIGRLEGVDGGVKQRLAAHLHRCMSSIHQISAFPPQNMFSALAQNCDKSTLVLPNVPSAPGDVNNNSNQNAERIQIPTGLHLIPSRLPTGELALLVPNSNHMSTFLSAPSGATIQFPAMSSVLSPTLGGTLGSGANRTSAFTAVAKNQDYPSPTSTADIVKKESEPVADDYKTTPYSGIIGMTDPPYMQSYNVKSYKVTETGEKTGEDMKKTPNLAQDLSEASRKFKTFEAKPEGGKAAQRPGSSSFQRTVADSTTSFLPPKEPEPPERAFKPFHVDIPNSRLKARISISENVDDLNSSLPIRQKPNPNFTLNPNKFYQKSPTKFTRSGAGADTNFSEMGYEKFLKIEPLSIVTEKSHEGAEALPKLEPSLMKSETFQSFEGLVKKAPASSVQRGPKRPPADDAPDTSPCSSESPAKAPRISLNVTLTDDQSRDGGGFANHCKRISVIVEDSSKAGGRENKNEVTVNVSSQKDMWRPW